MFRKLIFLTIAEFLILDQASYVASRQLNFTQFKDLFKPELYNRQILHDIPVGREVSYISDEAYDVGNSNELRQLIRRNGESDKYQHLCKIEKKLMEWKDDVYEYQPPFYVETFCKNIYESDNKQEQQKCVNPGFHCVQKTQTMVFVRRPWTSTNNCWELHTKDVASGCDCMWPSTLGNIFDHY
ncbi:uncharacterized protein LOC109857903 isoform X2 [Pseudomyrmex gracilis]|uniref:uncharacterized protein LOC109857903 isoform X2 n=1 Tax=Pseudomyrmex gracilis TaxID=219809 RepID=UPI000995AAE4|nr:uncharacterized protein LOC109857903 isoform X2 [Pseudomyrmex gracilis]